MNKDEQGGGQTERISSEMCKLENRKACVILSLRRYNERKIVMDKRLLRNIGSMMLLVCTLAAVNPVTAFAGWQKEGDTYAYYEDDGTRVENAFRKSGNQWFYLDENGQLLKNCEREIDGKIYVFNDRGAVVPSATRKAGSSEKTTDSDFSAISSRQQYLNKTANPYMNNETVQWINATYAILTRHNAGNIRAFGGSLKLDGKEENGAEIDKTTREQTRKMLKQSWGVTDKASADEALEELLQSAKDSGSAWDYSRAESNLGFYYLADYYTEKEALDKALEVAKEIQGAFDSWDSFVQSYLEGYEDDTGDSSGEREELYENLKASQWNPYSVSWNTKLKKSW